MSGSPEKILTISDTLPNSKSSNKVLQETVTDATNDADDSQKESSGMSVYQNHSPVQNYTESPKDIIETTSSEITSQPVTPTNYDPYQEDSRTTLSPEMSNVNPTIWFEDEELVKKIKSDSIGDTLYSERFVLNTIMKLTKLTEDLSKDKTFEKDLCSLWDMTIEKDVVRFLLSHMCTEIFTEIIDLTEDKRLTEILVGIIGNMCALPETRVVVREKPEIVLPIINLISCADSLTLIQVMRFLNAVLIFEDNVQDELEWIEHFQKSENFFHHFAFILSNSVNRTLLVQSMEALQSIYSKFSMLERDTNDKINNHNVCDLFIFPGMIDGIIEAFKTLIPDDSEDNQKDDISVPSQNTLKIIDHFLDINEMLWCYDKISINFYEPYIDGFLQCMSRIISMFSQEIVLIPPTAHPIAIIDSVCEMFQKIGDPFDEKCLNEMIKIWKLVDNYKCQLNNEEWTDSEGDTADEVSCEELKITILEFITRIVNNSTDVQLKNCLKSHPDTTIKKLLSSLTFGCDDDMDKDIKDCCTKIKNALNN